MLNKKALQFVWIPLSGVLALICLCMAVLQLFPAPTGEVQIREPFSVSSSRVNSDKSSPVYVCQLTGILFNPTGEDVTYTEIRVQMDAPGGAKTSVTVEATIPARSVREIFSEWESSVPYDRVTRVSVTEADGRVLELRIDGAFPTALLVYGILTLVFGTLCAYFVRQRMYVAEEERARRAAAETSDC